MQIFYLLFKPRLSFVAYIPSTAKLMNGFYAPLKKLYRNQSERENLLIHTESIPGIQKNQILRRWLEVHAFVHCVGIKALE